MKSIGMEAAIKKSMNKYTYVLKSLNGNMTSYDGFKWPKHGEVSCPIWNPAPQCGNGLDGFAEGEGNGDLANWKPTAVWVVVNVVTADIIKIKGINEGQVKFPKGYVVYCGDRKTATDLIKRKHPNAIAIIGAFIAASRLSIVNVGDYGTAISGYQSTSIAGNHGVASAGKYGLAVVGNHGIASAGECGVVSAGEYSTIQLTYFENKWRIKTGYIGEDGLKPNVKYKLNDHGTFMEVEEIV